MILDERTEFADASTDVQAATGRALIGNQIDLGVAGRDPGNGQSLYLVITVDTEVDSTGDAATVQFILASDASAAIATNGTATEHLLTEAFTETQLGAGATYVYPIPVGGDQPYERYLGVLALIGGETVTAGAVSAFLTLDPTGWKSYADATN